MPPPPPCPRPGRPAAAGERAAAHEPRAWFAVAAPGLEEVVRGEVGALPGALDVRAVDGGIEFRGPMEVGQRANLHLRVASRVLLRLGTLRARDFAKLRRLVAAMPWEELLPTDDALEIRASASRCRLYHTGALAEAAAAGIVERVGPRPEAKRDAVGGEGPEEDATPTSRVLLRGRQDEWTVSLDSSGALLHRRGFRIEAGKAPLRETLAAGLLALCQHDPARPFVDGMCGSGTIALEATARALGRAPGIARAFAFERWPAFDAAAWTRMKGEARAQEPASPPAPLFAFDRDPLTVQRARHNAARGGFEAALQIDVASFGARSVVAEGGLVVLNPPYGHRLSTRGPTERLYREIGQALRARFAGWRAGVLAPDPALARAIGLRPRATHVLDNGGLRVQLLVMDVPGP